MWNIVRIFETEPHLTDFYKEKAYTLSIFVLNVHTVNYQSSTLGVFKNKTWVGTGCLIGDGRLPKKKIKKKYEK